MEQLEYTNINRGTRGIFEGIEKEANRFCSICLILLAIVSFILVTIASIVDKSYYMHEVRIAIAILIVLSVSVGTYCLVKKEGSRRRKYILFFTWFIDLTLAVTFIDSSVTLLYAIPVLLAVRYNSVIFTLFVSLINTIFAFFPYLFNTYRGAYPLDFVVLEQGTTVQMAGASLDETINAIGSGLNRSETIINMLSYGYLTTVLLLLIIAVIAVSATDCNRKAILSQYNSKRSLMEDMEG